MESLPRPFGPYLLLEHAARGGMGDVYLARHGLLQGFEKHCVLKMLRSDHVDDTAALARFADEARVVVQLSHRNICPVFDVGRVGGRLYVAMEHVVGRDLRALDQAGPVPLSIALHVACEVLLALDYAHHFVDVKSGAPLGIVHRDVSPHNVLLGKDGDTKLIDFGIATTAADRVEQGDTVLGKLAYMSPEHARGDAVDGRADQWAAALVLAELIAHRPFHDGRSVQAIWEGAGTGTFRPAWWRDASVVDDSLRLLLDRALSPQAADRFDSCADFADALTTWARSHGHVAGPRDLQKHLARTFGDLAAEHRATLQRVREQPLVTGTLVGAPGSLPGAGNDEAPQFESIATTLAVPGNTPAFGDVPVTVLLRDRAAATGATAAAPPQRPLSLPLVAAVAALVGAAASLAFAVVVDGDDRGGDADAGAEVVVTLPETPPDSTPTPAPAPTPTPDPTPTPAPLPDPTRTPEPTPTTVLAPLTAPTTQEPPPAEPEPELATPPPPTKRASREKPVGLDAETRSGVGYLKGCVDKVPCARGMIEWSKKRLSPAQAAERKDGVLDCAKKCRLKG